MAKVLFIQQNYNTSSPSNNFPWMPVALVELASLILEKGHEAKILDRNLYYDNNKLIKILKNFNPDVVGMTCYTSPMIKDMKQVVEIIKKNSSALVIIGGTHATLEPKSLLDFPFIDFVVRGEGEQTLLEILSIIDKKGTNNKKIDKQISKIKNVNFNQMRPFMNLNELPSPNYDLLEVRKYPIATFFTSRGCPGKCTFCYNLGRQLRFYDTKKIIDTMTHVLGKYNIREFTIADDNFANLSKRTTQICDALSKFNAIFHIFQRVDQVQDKVMQDLKKAGCWSMQFGFESGSQRVLDFLNKQVTLEQNINAIKQCRKHNIFVDGSFMTGLPTETLSEMNETVAFVKKYKPDAVDIKIYTPYPNTELYNFGIKQGLMKKPETLDEWAEIGNLKAGAINLSKIPTPLLIKTVNELSKTSNLVYLKKALLLLKGKHYSYLSLKAKTILKNKLGLRYDDQKVK